MKFKKNTYHNIDNNKYFLSRKSAY